MRLEIKSKNINLTEFSPYINNYIKRSYNSFIKYNNSLITLWNDYFKEIFSKANRIPTLQSVVREFFNNQISIIQENGLSLLIKTNSDIVFTDNFKVEQLASLINNGNLSIRGYPIFDEIYTNISKSIPMIYRDWVNQKK